MQINTHCLTYNEFSYYEHPTKRAYFFMRREKTLLINIKFGYNESRAYILLNLMN